MAGPETPPPAYPGPDHAFPTFDREFIIARFKVAVGAFSSGNSVKIYSEDAILKDITPVLKRMFPRGNLRENSREHLVRVDLGYEAFEYWHLQIFKMLAARGFAMKTSHSSGTINEKMNSVTYTFAR